MDAVFDFIDDDEDDLVILSVLHHGNKKMRMEHIFRKRWDSDYLRDLAIREGTFLSEYRLDPSSFDLLLQMLSPRISVDEKMECVAMCGTGSAPITPDSRLGAALIMLAGGRRLESMRTHGISESLSYANFKKVVDAINDCPALAITCDNSPAGLRRRAAQFQQRSSMIERNHYEHDRSHRRRK